MVAELVAAAVLVLVAGAEFIHWQRLRRLAPLVFGPERKPSAIAHVAPWLRTVAMAALAWGLVSLCSVTPKVYEAEIVQPEEIRHVVLVLDVSPSMKLQDAGPEKKASRASRVQSIMNSFFKRVAMEQVRISVIGVYTGAKTVVEDTRDVEVVRNILDLPLDHAFDVGKTNIFAGLQQAADLAKTWRRDSTTIVLLSDGDTVPGTGMPKMPPSVSGVLVVGVGDPKTGKFIDGRQSRQDAATLRQIAVRLGGVYHNGNEKHLATDTLNNLTQTETKSPLEKLTRREYTLVACGVSAILLTFLPLLLQVAGTSWRVGVLRTQKPASARPRAGLRASESA